ncbi:MAG: hypothetical protein RL291_1080 [Pseudomonadota bacterium]
MIFGALAMIAAGYVLSVRRAPKANDAKTNLVPVLVPAAVTIGPMVAPQPSMEVPAVAKAVPAALAGPVVEEKPSTDTLRKFSHQSEMARLQSIVSGAMDRAEATRTVQTEAHEQLAAAELALERMLSEIRTAGAGVLPSHVRALLPQAEAALSVLPRARDAALAELSRAA